MKRIGYDSDSGRYYFSNSDGSLWAGPQGAEFGQMMRGKYCRGLAQMLLCEDTLEQH